MPCLLLVEGTCLIADADWLLVPDFCFSRDVNTWARHHTLRSDVWLILTKRCDYFWKLAVWNNNWQMACKDFLKEPSWLFVDAGWVSVFWQWSKPPQAAGIINHGTGVQPWLIVTLWPFLDFPAEDSRHLPSLQQNLTCLSRHSFGTPIHIYLPYPHHPSPPLPSPPILTSRNNVARLYTHRSKERAFLGHG